MGVPGAADAGRIAVLATVLWACASAPPPAEDLIEALVRAEDLVAAERPREASRVLGTIDRRFLSGDYLERFTLARARVLELEDRWWAAFKVLESFVEEHPFSPRLPEVRAMIVRLGFALVESGRGFWIFSSDRHDGLAVLEYFYVQFPEDRRLMPDVLQTLGDQAFRDGDWQRAIRRYQQIVREYSDPPSEWAELALFRSAMAHFHQIKGWDYDMDIQEAALRELRGYLDSNPRNPDFQEEAKRALATVTRWLATKRLSIAFFYRRVGKEAGYRHHLAVAAERFGETNEGREAARLLREMDP